MCLLTRSGYIYEVIFLAITNETYSVRKPTRPVRYLTKDPLPTIDLPDSVRVFRTFPFLVSMIISPSFVLVFHVYDKLHTYGNRRHTSLRLYTV